MTASTQSQPSSKRPYNSHHLLKEPLSEEAHQKAHNNHPRDIITRYPPVGNIPPAVPSPPPLPFRHRGTSSFEFTGRLATLHTIEMPSHENQWIFSPEVMLHTPSSHNGLPISEERSRRAKGVNFIIQAAIMLKLPQTTISTAAVYFHRFYMRHSLVPEKGGHHHYPIAATALFLATKAEEQCRKTKEIVICIAKVAQKNPSLVIDEQSKEFWRWKDNILQFEETMLETLTFDIHIDSPYRILSPIFEMFNLNHENRTLRNLAWAFLNDSSLTHLCVLQPAKDIAVAALFFALTHSGDKIPDDEDGNAWWERAGGTPSGIAQAMDIMYDLYEDNPLGKKDNPYERSPTDSHESKLERTRQRPENGNGINSQSHSEIDTPTRSAGVSTPDIKMREHINGNGVSREDGELTPNGIAPSEKETTGDHQDGSSDEKLKEAANDPATHENTASDAGAPITNGTLINHTQLATETPKRKAKDINDEVETNGALKRPRLENGTVIENGTMSDEEGEEGELEE